MKNRRTGEFIFDLIRREILTGSIGPGQRLLERELTEKYQVSRTPVREALKMLEQAQLVINIPYRGVEVRRLSRRFVRDVYDLRIAVEGLAAYLAAQRADDSELLEIDRVFRLIDQATDDGLRDRIMLLNNEFHAAIAAAAHNELLVDRVNDLWTNINLVRAGGWREGDRSESSRREHRRIVMALRAREPEGARLAMEEHVRSSWMMIERTLPEHETESEEKR